MSRFEFKMPKLGESITDAAIITWFKNVGDTIEQDEMLLEVATDKVDNEVPAPAAGTLVKTMFQAKDVVPVGEVMAILEVSEEVKSSNKKNVAKSDSEEPQKNKKEVKRPKPVQVASSSTSFSTSSCFVFCKFSVGLIKNSEIFSRNFFCWQLRTQGKTGHSSKGALCRQSRHVHRRIGNSPESL